MQLPTGSGSSCILFVIQFRSRTPAPGRGNVIRSICITFFGSWRRLQQNPCHTKPTKSSCKQTGKKEQTGIVQTDIYLTTVFDIGASFDHKNLQSCQEEIPPNSEQNNRAANDHKEVGHSIIKPFKKPLFPVRKSLESTEQMEDIQGKHLREIANATKAEKTPEQTFCDTYTKEGAGSILDERPSFGIYH